ncbi:MAG: ABC transporter ATP-binding protein [Halanaeroarchaeum sp.]
MSETALSTENLVKKFGSVTAVDGVSVDISTDQVVGIIGPNGAGKTTFVNLVTGVLEATDGTVTFDGEDITDVPEHGRVKRGLARSFQIPQIYNELSTLENVRAASIAREGKNNVFYRPLSRDPSTKEDALDYLEHFDLGDQADVTAESLAHGDRKILDIAMSFALEPKMVLLDEPTSGVGSESTDEIMQTTVDVARQSDTGILFIEHDMELVARYADRVIALHQGEVLSDGDPDDVLADEEVIEHIREEGA